jgi:hypothetical protein
MEEPMINSVDDCVKALDGMDLTPDEVSRFGKAFKDPEFLKMFADYAKEISDPAAKAETDAYLKQVEAEGRTKEVYGDVRAPILIHMRTSRRARGTPARHCASRHDAHIRSQAPRASMYKLCAHAPRGIRGQAPRPRLGWPRVTPTAVDDGGAHGANMVHE